VPYAPGTPKTGSTTVRARKSASTTFFTSPIATSATPAPSFTSAGSRGVESWGRNSRARTIGPATRCGKNDR